MCRSLPTFNQQAAAYGAAPCALNLPAWRRLLIGCPLTEAVRRTVWGIEFGEALGFIGRRRELIVPNPKWSEEVFRAIWNETVARLRDKTVIGPSLVPFFEFFRSSPLFTVPKDIHKLRVIHNLAAPKGESVNEGIDKTLFKLVCEYIDAAIALMLQAGRGCLLLKRDWASAYRQIPVTFKDWPLCGFQVRGWFFADTRLVFGCTASPGIFCRYSDLLQWIFRHKFNIRWTTKFYDDHLFVAPPAGSPPMEQSAELISQRIDEAVRQLGVQMNPAKRVGPTTRLVYLGITLDTVLMAAFLPTPKVEKLLAMVRNLLPRDSATRKEIEELQGLQNWACMVVRPGRAFLSRLTALIRVAERKQLSSVRIGTEGKLDLRWWDRFLVQYNGISFFMETEWYHAPDMRLAVDACAYGAGGYWGHRWFSVRFDSSYSNQCIREMIALVTACVAWGRFWQARKIMIYSDNTGVVSAVNKRRVRSQLLMQWVRELHLLEATFSFETRATWIQGSDNELADHLSRGRVEEFKRLYRKKFDDEPRLLPTAVRLPQVSIFI